MHEMMAKYVAILYLLFGFCLAVDPVPCKITSITLNAEPWCDINEQLRIDFEVKSIEPNSTCNPTGNVCLKIPSTIGFMGTYKDGEMLLVSGFTNTTAQIPVALLQANREFATPKVARFLDDGKGEATAVPPNKPLQFTWLSGTPTIENTAGCTKTVSGNTCMDFCCAIVGKLITIWGQKPKETKFINIKNGVGTIYIPLVVMTATDVDPSPLLLEVPFDGTISGFVNVILPFLPAVVKSGQTVLTSVATTATSCGTGATQCYKFASTEHTAEFNGKMPLEAITYTIKGAERMITYTFGNAGRAVKSGFIGLVAATATLFASRF